MKILRVRTALTIAATTAVTLLGTPAAGHHSASASGPLFRERYSVCSNPRDFRCVGAAAGKGAILDALRIDDQRAHDEARVSVFHDAARAAATYAIADAASPLRKALDLTVAASERKTHIELTKNAIRVEAAETLAALGDAASTTKIAALVREMETDGHGTLWADTLGALSKLDRGAAGRYGADFLARQKLDDFHSSMPGGTSREEILRHVVAAQTKDALPALQRITNPKTLEVSQTGSFCKLTAARLALGDEQLVAYARKLFPHPNGSLLATCDSDWLGAFPFSERDVPLIAKWLGRPDRGIDYGTTNVAYRRLLELLVASKGNPRADGMRAEIKRALVARVRWPHVGDPTSNAYSKHFVALHMAGLAGTGDPEAKKRLLDLVDDAGDESGATWLAAYWALTLEIPGAVDRASSLLVRGTQRADHARGSVMKDIRMRVVDAMILRAPTDDRWSIALLDAEPDVRERVVFLLSRRLPGQACTLVTDHAFVATTAAVESAFLALASLGDSCRPQFERIAKDDRAPARARGMSLEMLATMKSPVVTELADKVVSQPDMSPYVRRAVAIASRDGLVVARP